MFEDSTSFLPFKELLDPLLTFAKNGLSPSLSMALDAADQGTLSLSSFAIGSWILDLPLWFNPFIPSPSEGAAAAWPPSRAQGFRGPLGSFLSRLQICTLGQFASLIRLLRVYCLALDSPDPIAWARARRENHPAEDQLLKSVTPHNTVPSTALREAEQWLSTFPPPFVSFLYSSILILPLSLDSDVVIPLLDNLAVFNSASRLTVALGVLSGTETLLLGDCSVRKFTYHIRLPTAQDRARRRFVATALGAPDLVPQEGVFPPETLRAAGAPLNSTFHRLSRLPLDNSIKEVFWRLVYDATPCRIIRFRNFAGQVSCTLCATQPMDRSHMFWSCSIPQAILHSISQHLSACGITSPLLREHLWLMRSPSPHITSDVWSVVASIFLDTSRSYGQRLISAEPITLPPAFTAAAVSTFWKKFHVFVSDLNQMPKYREVFRGRLATAASLLPPHICLPFIRYSPASHTLYSPV